MSLLLAALQIEAERAAKRFAAAFVERAKGFSDREAGDFLSGADVLADAEAEQEVHEPRAHTTELIKCTKCDGDGTTTGAYRDCRRCDGNGFIREHPEALRRNKTSAPAAHSPGPVAAEDAPSPTSSASPRAGSGHSNSPAATGSQRGTGNPEAVSVPPTPASGQPLDDDLKLLCRNAAGGLGNWLDGHRCGDETYWESVIGRLMHVATK